MKKWFCNFVLAAYGGQLMRQKYITERGFMLSFCK